MKKLNWKKEKKFKFMKIRTTKKLLKLKLIQTKTYKKTWILNSFNIEDIEYRLKRSLQIIKKYHINGKKILFMTSFSTTKLNHLLKRTKHSVKNEYFSTNEKTNNKYFYLSKDNYNLVVIFGEWSNKSFIDESYKRKIPIIFIGQPLNIFDTTLNHKVPGNFSFHGKKIRKNLFLLLLKNIITKKYGFKKNYDFKKKK